MLGSESKIAYYRCTDEPLNLVHVALVACMKGGKFFEKPLNNFSL
jgi:hypothetical protein